MKYNGPKTEEDGPNPRIHIPVVVCIFFKKIYGYLFLIYEYEHLPSHMSMYYTYAWCSETSEKSIGSPASGVTASWESLCGS